VPVRPQAGHRTTKTRWPSSNAGAMTVVVPHLTHGGGGGWNSSGMMSGSLAFRRERDWSLGHRRLSSELIAGDCKNVGCRGESTSRGGKKGKRPTINSLDVSYFAQTPDGQRRKQPDGRCAIATRSVFDSTF
jgi:hypothetical protein